MLKGKLSRCLNVLYVINLIKPINFLWQSENLLNYLCRCTVQNLEANFRNLIGVEVAVDLILPFLSLVKNDLCSFCYIFFLFVSFQIKWAWTTESTNILYISVSVTHPIKLNIKKISSSEYSVSWKGTNIYLKATTSLIM